MKAELLDSFGEYMESTAKKKTRSLAMLGIAFLCVVILTHIAEHWHFFAGMGWGLPNSPGHYVDLVSAILGVALLLAALIWRQISN